MPPARTVPHPGPWGSLVRGHQALPFYVWGWLEREVLLTPSALISHIACGNETAAGMWLEGAGPGLRSVAEGRA